MKPEGSTKVAAIQTTFTEERMKKSAAHSMRSAATDKENVYGTGRSLQSTDTIKNMLSNNVKGSIKKTVDKSVIKGDATNKSSDKIKADSKRLQQDSKGEGKMMKDKAVQTEFTSKSEVSKEDLTSEESPSENYWVTLAERRGIAIQSTLKENQMLSEKLEVYKEMLDESRALVEVLQEMIGEDRSDINNSLDDSGF